MKSEKLGCIFSLLKKPRAENILILLLVLQSGILKFHLSYAEEEVPIFYNFKNCSQYHPHPVRFVPIEQVIQIQKFYAYPA